VLQLTLVLYLPAIAVVALLGWLLRKSALPLRAKHLFFVAISVLLLTPVPTPAATLYVMLIPSWLVFTSNDPAWYLQFWRFGAVAGVATAFVCWLLAPMFLGEIRQRATRISPLLHKVLVGTASTVVWETLAGALIARLEEEWPSQLAFRDGGGHVIPKPSELQ
jgi:hypothetical protein